MITSGSHAQEINCSPFFIFYMILQVNNTVVENLSLVDAKRNIERSKDRLTLVIVKNAPTAGRRPLSQHVDHAGLEIWDSTSDFLV